MFIENSSGVSSLSDIQLTEKYRHSGDLHTLGILYERYMHLVYGVSLKYLKNTEDSKDAVMGIFEKLIIELQKHEVENFKSWLHVTTRNYCLMKLRSVKHRNDSHMVEVNDHEDMDYQLPLHHEEDELESDLSVLRGCIDELKADQKNSVKLFFLEQKCYQEIADITGFELKKVKSYIQNGKRNLKLCVERNRERA